MASIIAEVNISTRQKLFAVLLLVLSAAVQIYGRVPTMTEDFCDPDVAVMSYGAIDLLDGGSIYERCVETKPPGAYILFAAMFKLFGKRLLPIYVLAALLHLLAFVLIAVMAWRLGGPTAGVFAGWFYTLLVIDAQAAANCPNQETWMTFFGVFGFALLLPTRRAVPMVRALLAGVMFGIAVLMKQQAGAFVIAGALWLALEWPRDERRVGANMALFGFGVALPLAAVVVAWAVRGGLGTMLSDLNPNRLSQYVGVGNRKDILFWAWRRLSAYIGGSWPVWLAAAAGLPFIVREKMQRRTGLRVWLYFLAAFAALAAGTRFYNHYFMILAAPLALAGGYGLGLIVDKLPRGAWRALLLVVLLSATLNSSRFELLQSTRMLQAISRGEEMINDDMLEYLLTSDLNLRLRHQDKRHQRLGAYIKEHSAPNESLYVWPYKPQLYFWADRRSPTKHYMYFDVAVNLPFKHGGWHGEVDNVVLASRRQMMADLEADPPRFVIMPENDIYWDRAFDRLRQWVADNYTLDENAPHDFLRVYRRPETGE